MSDEKTRILIVDDDENLRSMYAEVFKNSGFSVEEAIDGVDGLDKATKNPPEVIFTGIVMPRMDGFALIESLKKGVATKDIPVVISSHLGREEDREKAQAVGVSEFIVRDITPPNEVAKIIKGVIRGGKIYNLNFDPYGMDAPRLARDLKASGDFKCPKCQGRMVVRLSVKDLENKGMEAKIVCPKCD